MLSSRVTNLTREKDQHQATSKRLLKEISDLEEAVQVLQQEHKKHQSEYERMQGDQERKEQEKQKRYTECTTAETAFGQLNDRLMRNLAENVAVKLAKLNEAMRAMNTRSSGVEKERMEVQQQMEEVRNNQKNQESKRQLIEVSESKF